MRATILVVALNPSIDVEWTVRGVRWEEKNVILSERRWAGGKGVNVARWLAQLGAEVELLLAIGGPRGEELLYGLQGSGIVVRPIKLREQTRANIVVTTSERRQLRFNPPGPAVSSQEWMQINGALRTASRRAAVVVFSGSIPPGVPVAGYRELISIAQKTGLKCILDCDGAPFAQAIRARPLLVKPNRHELQQWCGHRLGTRREMLDAAKALSTVTRQWVLLSRGPASALLVNSLLGQLFEAPAIRGSVVNTVGAGDAMLAGAVKAIGDDLPPVAWLQLGVAAGSAAVRHRAGILAGTHLIKRLARETHRKIKQREL